MRALLVLALTLPPPALAATLNKCVDAKTGQVTYTNLRCGKSQQKALVELDPPPVPERKPRTPAPIALPAAAIAPVPAAPPAATASPAAVAPPAAPPPGPGQRATPRPRLAQPDQAQCDLLSQQLGHVLDRMDAEREAPAEQVQSWQSQIEELKTKRGSLGCF